MSEMENSSSLRWRIEDIDFDLVDTEAVHDNEFLFHMLASASFVEILADKYSANLIAHFGDNAEVTTWLKESWQEEEVQHGRALKAYVNKVWPEFDWDAAHAAFWQEYSSFCLVEQLEPQRGLELMGRCVVETGTTTMYRAIYNYVREPVLRQMIGNIAADESAHYAHFRRYFSTYNAVEKHGFGTVAAAIWRRMRDIGGQDAYLAFKHVYAARHPERPFQESDWRRYHKAVKVQSRRDYPHAVAVKMLLRPIPMFEPFRRLLEWPLLGVAKLVSLS
jgi:rubrerythrin